MSKIKSTVAKTIKLIAKCGAGTASLGFSYEPKLPEKLKKNS